MRTWERNNNNKKLGFRNDNKIFNYIFMAYESKKKIK